VNSCPYDDVSDEVYARLNAKVEVMNEQHMHFLSEMGKCDLFHEIDPSLSFPRLESSLYDYCESSLPLDSIVVDDAPSTNLEEVFVPPLISLPLAAPSFSSTPIATIISDLTLLTSPLPLAQCTGLEMGGTSKVDVSVLDDDSLDLSKELCLVEPYF